MHECKIIGKKEQKTDKGKLYKSFVHEWQINKPD